MDEETENDPSALLAETETAEPATSNEKLPLRDTIAMVTGVAVVVAATFFGTGLIYWENYLTFLHIPPLEVSLVSWRYNYLGAVIAVFWFIISAFAIFIASNERNASFNRQEYFIRYLLRNAKRPLATLLVLAFLMAIYLSGGLPVSVITILLLFLCAATFLILIFVAAYEMGSPLMRRKNTSHLVDVTIAYFMGLLVLTFIAGSARAYRNVKLEAPQVRIRVTGAEFYSPSSTITSTVLSPNEISYEGMYLLLSDDNQIFLTDNVASNCQPETVYAMPQSSVTGLEYLAARNRADPCPRSFPIHTLAQTPAAPSASP